MTVITLSVKIPPDHHLELDLPPELPAGMAQITIQSASSALEVTNPSREDARAKLLAAGLLSTTHLAPKDAFRVSDEELHRLGTLPPGVPSLDDLIDQDRGPY